jgi:activator of HSP90 ATPase
MDESLKLTADFPVSAQRLYTAWLDSKEHAAFTSSPAKIDKNVGGSFTAWDGYISGTNLELEPGRRIIQAWRTTEFPESSPDSRLELLFEPIEGGARLSMVHSAIPQGQSEEYKQGWEDYYFKPMQEYFQKE